MADDGVEQSGQSDLVRWEVIRTCNSWSVVLMDVISSPSGNGNNGVVGILLRSLLKFDEDSVASFHQTTRVSPKSCMSQKYAGVDRSSPSSRV
jgi:hypothetical protein